MSTSNDEVTEQEQEPQKRKRRSSAEVQAEREAKALASAQGVLASAQGSALPPSETMKPLEAIATLASNDIDPSEYSDMYCLMKDCIRVKRQYNMTDKQFMELMDRFDDRVTEYKKGRK